MSLNEDNIDNDLIDCDEYSNKYFKLIKKCDSIKLENERLINDIYKIKKLLLKYNKQKRILINRLQKHKDDYRNHDYPLFVENEVSQQLNKDSTKGFTNIKSKNCVKQNGNNFTSKAKKSRNLNRSDSTSHGSVSGAPKKPINPYLLFCQENRSTIQEQYYQKHNTEISHQELTKTLAQNWHELSVSEKQVYYNLFNNDKVRYENEMKLFTANSKKQTETESCDT